MKKELGVHSACHRKRSGSNKESFTLLLFTLPVVIYLFVMNYIPMGGLIIAFKDYKVSKGIFASEWNGFKNFEFFFKSQDLFTIVRNTVSYGIVFIILGIIAAVIVALLLFEVKKRYAVKLYQTVMILPHFLSWVIVSYIAYILLNPISGILNRAVETLGGTGNDWYSNPAYWPYILTLFNIWKSVGLNVIMYYAALMGVDESLYEAARIDGANKLQQSWYISIPEIVPVMMIVLILGVGGMFHSDFGLFYQLPKDIGVLYPTTDVIDTYIYRGLRTGNLSITTAVGLIQSVVGCTMVVLTNLIVKKISPESSMF